MPFDKYSSRQLGFQLPLLLLFVALQFLLVLLDYMYLTVNSYYCEACRRNPCTPHRDTRVSTRICLTLGIVI